jgi:hypothetical protein
VKVLTWGPFPWDHLRVAVSFHFHRAPAKNNWNFFAALPDVVNPVTSIDPAPGREQYSVWDTCALERGNRPVQSVCLGEAHSR